MKPWIRLTLIVMTVGGGFSGFARTLEALFDSSGASTLNLLFKVVFLGLYAFVAASGLLFVQDPTRTGTLRAALAIQIPFISSPFIVYKFAAGLAAFLSFGSPEGENTGLYIGWELRLGSFWSFYLQQDKPLRIGVNLAALAILVSLWAAVQPANSMTPQKQE
jgi:hypothetical protein